MSDQGQPIQDLLRRRLALVSTISGLSARTHKLIQENAGAEMEILRLQLALGRSPADGALLQALKETEHRAETIRSQQEDCVAEIEAVEAAVMDIDRQIASTKGGSS